MISEIKSKFCMLCGNALDFIDVGARTAPACSKPNCDFVDWNNPAPGAHVLLSLDGRILLVKRGKNPMKGDWCLPGGYMESFESPDETAARELFEETGLETIVNKKNILSVVAEGHNDVQIFYWSTKLTGGTMRLSNETTDLRFFEEHELPKNIAFESHAQVIQTWFAKNRRKSNVVRFVDQALAPNEDLAYN
jgi:ADP-ribose pyrophosphatase YjhB (NUDIX family)